MGFFFILFFFFFNFSCLFYLRNGFVTTATTIFFLFFSFLFLFASVFFSCSAFRKPVFIFFLCPLLRVLDMGTRCSPISPVRSAPGHALALHREHLGRYCMNLK